MRITILQYTFLRTMVDYGYLRTNMIIVDYVPALCASFSMYFHKSNQKFASNYVQLYFTCFWLVNAFFSVACHTVIETVMSHLPSRSMYTFMCVKFSACAEGQLTNFFFESTYSFLQVRGHS